MAPLSGLQIQKLLPKTNCKECGSNTCLAFAMKLAAKKAELSACPYVSEEAKAELGAAAEPPIRTVKLGAPNGITVGGETVMFRHEKTFVNAMGLGISVDDTLTDDEIERRVKAIAEYRLERVGEELRPNVVSVARKNGSSARFLAVIQRVAELWDQVVVVRSAEVSDLRAAAEALRGRRPLLASATPDTVKELGEIAKANEAALAVASDEFDELAEMVETLRSIDFKDILLELSADTLCEHVQNNTIIRRGALKSGIKDLGYPMLRYIDTGNALDDAVEAGIEIVKYGGVAILPTFDPSTFVSLLALRQNIYTDPQKPIQVEPCLRGCLSRSVKA
ncbi:MAG: acetyl-CoA decarbonylase/synthase complex subunit gamma [Candidatus Hydrogenedentes bacterium]|nr:acetyl-CoA decarbonylase/synthase complex subunit gamma [Candidatus Hydrogenedentota bacterium]